MKTHSGATVPTVKSVRGYKLYTIMVTVLLLLSLAAFAVVFIHAGYHTKVLVKLGLKEQTATKSHAILAWENCLDKMDYDADVVFFGDSITYESDFAAQFPHLKIVNLGYSGDTLSGMINRVPMVQSVKPEKIFILGGINGLTDTNIEQSVALYKSLLNELQEALPEADIYIQSVLPISKEQEISLTNICHNETILTFNQHLAQLAQEKGLTYIDIHALYYLDGELDPQLTYDGIHLVKDAYGLWENEIDQYLNAQ